MRISDWDFDDFHRSWPLRSSLLFGHPQRLACLENMGIVAPDLLHQISREEIMVGFADHVLGLNAEGLGKTVVCKSKATVAVLAPHTERNAFDERMIKRLGD